MSKSNILQKLKLAIFYSYFVDYFNSYFIFIIITICFYSLNYFQ